MINSPQEEQMQIVTDLIRVSRKDYLKAAKREISTFKTATDTKNLEIEQKIRELESQIDLEKQKYKEIFDVAREFYSKISSSKRDSSARVELHNLEIKFFDLLRKFPMDHPLNKVFDDKTENIEPFLILNKADIKNVAVLVKSKMENLEDVTKKTVSAIITQTSKLMDECEKPYLDKINPLKEEYNLNNLRFRAMRKDTLANYASILSSELKGLCEDMHGLPRNEMTIIYSDILRFLQDGTIDENLLFLDNESIFDNLENMVNEGFIDSNSALKFKFGYVEALEKLDFVDSPVSQTTLPSEVNGTQKEKFVYVPNVDSDVDKKDQLTIINEMLLESDYDPNIVHGIVKSFKGKFMGGRVIPYWAVKKNASHQLTNKELGDFDKYLSILVREGLVLKNDTAYSLNVGTIKDPALQLLLNFYLKR